ncbi:hypothetical protein KCH_45460 [Kitasatospora cheerisanensis KCTC 2395]|uniref:Uncharacterized protein n=1 Tax=Kitasatospora cheerisanensis KCTC 2395 TaxID=1348663 RepID=A0A066YRM5_9ACTN|nr:hypothetical protein KCH_45460 [Kitasatospora cheerisanensis KCTC 2395]
MGISLGLGAPARGSGRPPRFSLASCFPGFAFLRFRSRRCLNYDRVPNIRAVGDVSSAGA